MNELKHIETISEMMQKLGISEVHNPLIGVTDMKEATQATSFDGLRISFGFFMIVYKKSFCGNVLYGQNHYDYNEGTLLFFAPYQTLNIQDLAQSKPEGCILMFHPELLHGTILDRKIKNYTFFGYNTNESLHISENEKVQFLDYIKCIHTELKRNKDNGDSKIFISYISSLLNLCQHFYERQFATRQILCNDIVSRFEQLVLNYLSDEKSFRNGLPSMTYLAEHLFLSPNYLGDLIKNATGRSAKEFINKHVIEEAKRRLTSSEIPVNEIAYSLGFEYPQYFSQMFKKHVGMTPKQYREHINLSRKHVE